MATGGKHIDIGPHESLVTTAIMAVCYKEAGPEHLLVINYSISSRAVVFVYIHKRSVNVGIFRDIFELFNGEITAITGTPYSYNGCCCIWDAFFYHDVFPIRRNPNKIRHSRKNNSNEVRNKSDDNKTYPVTI